jgi:hypothetical protein
VPSLPLPPLKYCNTLRRDRSMWPLAAAPHLRRRHYRCQQVCKPRNQIINPKPLSFNQTLFPSPSTIKLILKCCCSPNKGDQFYEKMISGM